SPTLAWSSGARRGGWALINNELRSRPGDRSDQPSITGDFACDATRGRMKLNAELIRRYDCHGPRYTSYPTAVQFHAGFDEQNYRRVALLSNATAARPLSIYVHVPFCASPCFYCGCTKIITRNPAHVEQYMRRLHR